LIRPSVA